MVEPFLPYIIGLVAVVAGLFGYGKIQRNKGRQEVEQEINKNSLEAIRKSNENRQEISGMDDLPSVFDRLHNKRRR